MEKSADGNPVFCHGGDNRGCRVLRSPVVTCVARAASQEQGERGGGESYDAGKGPGVWYR